MSVSRFVVCLILGLHACGILGGNPGDSSALHHVEDNEAQIYETAEDTRAGIPGSGPDPNPPGGPEVAEPNRDPPQKRNPSRSEINEGFSVLKHAKPFKNVADMLRAHGGNKNKGVETRASYAGAVERGTKSVVKKATKSHKSVQSMPTDEVTTTTKEKENKKKKRSIAFKDTDITEPRKNKPVTKMEAPRGEEKTITRKTRKTHHDNVMFKGGAEMITDLLNPKGKKDQPMTLVQPNNDVTINVRYKVGKVARRCRNTLCLNGGRCDPGIGREKPKCVCPSSTSGDRCQVISNPCKKSPCNNGGFCLSLGTQFSCLCPSGFSGWRCDKNIHCASMPCANGGVCVPKDMSFTCKCKKGYSGAMCQRKSGKCPVNSCMNGGTCTLVDNIPYCMCPKGYQGPYCESDMGECSNSLCVNGGVCMKKDKDITCLCPDGYTGKYCQENTDECASNPCKNKGICVDGHNSFQCNCLAGYTGTLCQVNINECASSPCRNGGVCHDGPNNYTCECGAHASGIHCEILEPSCNPSPCHHDGKCVVEGGIRKCICSNKYTGSFCEERTDGCSEGSCQNGGKCVKPSKNLPAKCVCQTGFAGKMCQIPVKPEVKHMCASSPCLNEGVCHEHDDGFLCECREHYKGVRCETAEANCDKNPCKNGGECVIAHGERKCVCGKQFTGTNCERRIPVQDECTQNSCANGGSCVRAAKNTPAKCVCKNGYDGPFCQHKNVEIVLIPPPPTTTTVATTTVKTCDKNVCQNGGKCFLLGLTYHCECLPGFTGIKCENTLTGCNALGCQNGGSCLPTYNGTYHCVCPATKTGTYCEVSAVIGCQPYTCKNDGICKPDSQNISKFTCECGKSFTGERCESRVDFCASGPCQNHATCTSHLNSYLCICDNFYTGINCETMLVPNAPMYAPTPLPSPKPPDKHIYLNTEFPHLMADEGGSAPSRMYPTAIVAIVLGVALFILVITCVAIAIYIRCRTNTRPRSPLYSVVAQSDEGFPTASASQASTSASKQPPFISRSRASVTGQNPPNENNSARLLRREIEPYRRPPAAITTSEESD